MEQTNEDAARKYTDFFGDSDGKTVHLITEAVSRLYLEWRVFLYFFCGDKRRLDVLNMASGSTALLLQSLLWNNALIKVRSLTDQADSGHNRNLSIGQLVRISAKATDTDIRAQYEETMQRAKPCRKYADKYLTHLDLSHAHRRKVTTINRKSTTDAIKAIGSFVKEFHRVTRDVQYNLMPISPHSDETQFLMRLHLGNQKAHQLKSEQLGRLKAGERFDHSEYARPTWIDDDESRFPTFDF